MPLLTNSRGRATIKLSGCVGPQNGLGTCRTARPRRTVNWYVDGEKDKPVLALSSLLVRCSFQPRPKLTSITAERNAANERASRSDQLPPVMPHELVKYSRAEFCGTVRKHVLRLEAAKLTVQQIEAIEEHRELIRSYHSEEMSEQWLLT